MSKIFLETLFNEGEQVCVSPSKYAFSSISQDKISGSFELESQNKDREIYTVAEDDILLVAMNPIVGDRKDSNVTALRTFLVEIDGENVYDQKMYIDGLQMPHTVCIFSGNKSLHYGITLSEDLPNEEMWRDINEWILAIVSKADQQTKNPSRSIRFPGNKRKDGLGLMQQLIEVKSRIPLDNLFDWLSQYPDKNPRLKKATLRKQLHVPISSGTELDEWVVKKLTDGIGSYGPRNNGWYSVACNLAEKGHDAETIELTLQHYFVPEHDFPYSEFLICIKSAANRFAIGYHD